MTNFSRPDFLDKVKKQDRDALSQLIDAYTSHLFKAALGMGLNEEMSHDVTASTWTTFIEVVPRFKERSHIRTFLFGIFYNKVSELRRSNLKFLKTDPIEEVLESNFSEDGQWTTKWASPEESFERKEIMSIMEKCIDHLPVLQRSAFYMKHVEEETTEVICATLKISNVNLRQLIFRAKNRIRNCITLATTS